MKRFTLIELIVASVVLVIALIGIPAFYFASHRNLRTSRLKRLATWQATSKMEELKATPYDDLEDGNENVQLGWTEADMVWEVTTVEDEGLEYKRITVTVSYGESGEVSLVTYVGED
jgi:Tfp pilus assembly protein PilV